MRQKILLMYITVRSGHYQAARAVEQGIRRVRPEAEIFLIDAFAYLNPVLARIVDRMYLSMIQNWPDLWDFLYDNPRIVRRSDRLRWLLHKYDSPRLKGLLEEFGPDAVACTQAFPCGLVADYKQQAGLEIPLYGVITDFLPHAYWLSPQVNGYVVAGEAARTWLADRRVPEDRIHSFGIPINPVFSDRPDAGLIRRRLQISESVPVLLLMGGGQGLGPLLETVKGLDRLPQPLQMIVVAGSNEALYHRLIRLAPRLSHRLQVFGHVDFVSDLMSVADFIITKPGGVTTSEALAKQLPIVALNPIPGQEARNAEVLEAAGAAVIAKGPQAACRIVEEFLAEPGRLDRLRSKARTLGRPDSAVKTGRLILGAA